MPRIRVRTSNGERVVGTPNTSTLTLRVIAHGQRSTLQVRADAEVIGGARVLEHLTWDFPEIDNHSAIELVSEPSPSDRFDPPDSSHSPSVPVKPEANGQSIAEIRAVEKELEALSASLKAFGVSRHPSSYAPSERPAGSPTYYCSFCGKSQDEVRKLIAGPGVFICDECIAQANDLASK